jgi:hypothetical protein
MVKVAPMRRNPQGVTEDTEAQRAQRKRRARHLCASFFLCVLCVEMMVGVAVYAATSLPLTEAGGGAGIPVTPCGDGELDHQQECQSIWQLLVFA